MPKKAFIQKNGVLNVMFSLPPSQFENRLKWFQRSMRKYGKNWQESWYLQSRISQLGMTSGARFFFHESEESYSTVFCVNTLALEDR